MTSPAVWLLSVCLLTPQGPGIEDCYQPSAKYDTESDRLTMGDVKDQQFVFSNLPDCISAARDISHGNIQAHCTDDRGRVAVP
jgi:hypothetical protein